MAIKVIVADSYPLIRIGIKAVLSHDKDIQIIGEAEDGEEAIKLVKTMNPHVLLVDLDIPKINAFEIIKRVSNLCNIIIMTGRENDNYVKEIAACGISGYILKTSPVSVFPVAVKKAASDTFVVKPKEAGLNMRTGNLSLREIEVLQLIGKGYSNAQIAKELYLSEKTVKNHLTSIFKKIGVDDRTNALLYALKNKIVLLRE